MKIQRRDEMINQNEMQLKFKMDQMKKEKENEFIESQKVSVLSAYPSLVQTSRDEIYIT